ncbi:helix-turn-helix domain-containing protein [Rhodococcus sp. Z13]|uniref:Helix-turn-helix domain-containing protein n=1 Tax=Rhodococcus sacchari TaxID=2962047 RepID=A0ACD4DHG6_9NOCA|nr:IclR family transcriptional regulator C-terminal domain-containing protein [Rhodococcus sp. Z13]UYP19138.1 helix-turn-helix domain-containing protein [Rhodococcus sp. Z13]
MTAHVPIRSSEATFGGRQPHAVQKALGMLEAVAQLGPGTTAKEIAAFAGVPPATAYRMLNLLVADGYLVRVPDLSGFALGRRTAELAHAAAESNPSESLHDVMEDLRGCTRFGLHVASFAGGRLRFVDQDPDHEIVAITTLSKTLHANAIGKLMLAHVPGVCPQPELRRLTEFTICDRDSLSRELRDVVTLGYAHEHQETRPGRSALAVPVRDSSSFVVGGLYLHGSAAKVQPDPELVRFLVEGSSRLTGLL